jgi:hypothetical protein
MTSSADAAMHTANDLITALEKPHPTTPFNIGNEQVRALRQLADIFSNATKPLAAPTTTAKSVEPAPALRVEDQTQETPEPTHQHFTRSQARANATIVNHLWEPTLGTDAYTTASPTPNMYIPMANAVLHPETGEVMSYDKLIMDPATQSTWKRSAANEFGRLAHAVGGRVQGTNTIKFIPVADVPKNRTVTYARFVCDCRPQKSEPEHTRLANGWWKSH